MRACVCACVCELSSNAPSHLLFHVLDGVARLDVEGDGLASQCLDENLHVVGGMFTT